MDIEILIAGGSAGLITGLLKGDLTTQDCDVIAYTPGHAWCVLESPAAEIAAETGLYEKWLNSDMQVRLDINMLPAGWYMRRRLTAHYGDLRQALDNLMVHPDLA